jgi:perosamine synthetase
MEINFFNTYIHPEAAQKVNATLQSTLLSEGQLVRQFEKKLNDELGLQNCVTVNSGTAALHLALVVAGVGPGDEVIIPAQTFVATGLVVVQQLAKVVFADIDYSTGNISVESFKEKITDRTKAVIPVHWGGYPCDMDEINALAQQHDIIVIEDAAHALGATYKGKFIGELSDYSCFSFQAIKHLTTGDGGAIAIRDEKKYKEAITRKWFGIDRDKAPLSELGERQYNIDKLGFKYHLNNYGASLGLANLNGFHDRMSKRRNIAGFYTESLRGVPGVSLLNYKNDRLSSFWVYCMHVEKQMDFIRALKSRGIPTSVVHQRIDRNEIFGGLARELINQEKFDATQIHIPIHDAIDQEKASMIVDKIKEGW